ncbi:hypothetical protein D3C77_773170 [compost metagenome]
MKAGRAIRLCCTANRASSTRSMSSAGRDAIRGAPSMVSGTPGRSPTKAMA